jgi:hypothetical protein
MIIDYLFDFGKGAIVGLETLSPDSKGKIILGLVLMLLVVYMIPVLPELPKTRGRKK